MRVLYLAIFALPFGLGAAAVQAQGSLASCGSYPQTSESYACLCAPGDSTGTVWGSGPYTADSNICAAAGHAGAIGPDGGPVLTFLLPGEASYVGSLQNGVSSRDWGSYANSFFFDAYEDVDITVAANLCTVMPADAEILTCGCPAGPDSGARIWGSDPYTADSNLCSAARHAGLIGNNGGQITALRLPGLQAYRGSEMNGITSNPYGSYASSVTFDRNM